ncbi:hypothetical protein EGR_06509 [Echinococcus granulosus]|uniref:Zinc finger C2H2 type n=1 Tax=Echinococcus granulosus TaxID=6210 RepID=W6UCY2_ECHGR|nr:hypothetical protein EGR_06509 [Echinococcus granulosus]EUB58626.1 hypothetical protein EGR_06509 [Echinococcus granulosus]
MTTSSTRQKSSLRPYTSHGRLPSNIQLVRRHQPPFHLLPPCPPPPPPQSSITLPLPNLPNPPAKRLPQRVRLRRIPSSSSCVKKVDASADTRDLHANVRYICRLCGLNCLSGDLLHAHLLLLRHSSLSFHDILLNCRQCGASWRLEDEDEEKRCQNHPCFLQKAAYFKNFLAPSRSIRQGLPFMCLFCCAESMEGEDVSKGTLKRPPRRITRKTMPLKRCQAMARFASKLELAVHIRYAHDPSRQPGRCSECHDFVCESRELPEIEFWEASKSSSESRPISTDSILYREGLNPLELHIQGIHMESYEYLQWLNSKRYRTVPRDLAEKLFKSRTTWIYSCPLCQLHPFSSHSSKDFSTVQPEVGLPSNASLQAHIACFHSAGRSFLDWRFQVCAVCGDFNAASEYKHLLKRGHMTPLKKYFSQALRQGRFAAVEGSESVEWRSTCVLCWRRFESGGGKVDLRSECRLQAHLLSTHCIFNATKGKEFNVLACGWCGGLRKEELEWTNGREWKASGAFLRARDLILDVKEVYELKTAFCVYTERSEEQYHLRLSPKSLIKGRIRYQMPYTSPTMIPGRLHESESFNWSTEASDSSCIRKDGPANQIN